MRIRLTLEVTRARPSAPPQRETCLDADVERADQVPDRPPIGFRSMDPEQRA